MAKILVVDDVLDAGILIQRILEKKGHEVQVFTDEDQALSHAKDNRFDLVILDMKLRKMEGTEVLLELKKTQPEIQSIFLTGYPTMDTARRARELGATAYCVKPVDKEEIEAKVAEALKTV